MQKHKKTYLIIILAALLAMILIWLYFAGRINKVESVAAGKLIEDNHPQS